MADFRPFQAIRYDFDKLDRNLSNVLAPPYDVLDQADKDALLARSRHNIVAIDLPFLPPKRLGPQEAYDKAAITMYKWLDEGVLIRESQPAIYVYHQIFEHGGKTFTRKKMLANLRCEPFNAGVILPHEQTFGGPKEDRLALMKATRTQLSPIFGLYTDADDVIGNALASAINRDPDAVGTLDGVENRVWIVTDPAVLKKVTGEMADKKIFIADGHHRYSTALMYRDEVEREQGQLAPNHPANFTMFVLGSMDDPGSLILPYPRVLQQANCSTLALAQNWGDAVQLVPKGEHDMILFDGADGSEIPLKFAHRERLDDLAPEQSEAWRKLDVAYLHRYLIDEFLTEPSIKYVKSIDMAKQAAKDEHGIALLINATPMEHLRDVSIAGDLMPQKSTYFHPKIATGITLNALA